MPAEFKRREPYPIHPLATVRPEMPEGQFEVLKQDIVTQGQKEAVVLFEDMILDGRARQRACLELGVPARYKVYRAKSGLEAWRHAHSLNQHRQHARAETGALPASSCAADRLPEVEGLLGQIHEEAKGRRNAKLRQYRTPSASPDANGKSSTLIGLLAGGVSSATVERVLVVKRQNFRLFDMIAAGKLSAGQAIRQISKANRIFAAMAACYRILYADPPWPYGVGTSIEHDPSLHYRTMTLQALCEMPVRRHVNKNAALFLWTTSFFLARAMEVAHAWGFAYRSNLVWKKRHRQGAGIVTGGWSNMQHEHLLICTRGRMEPDTRVCEPSVAGVPGDGPFGQAGLLPPTD